MGRYPNLPEELHRLVSDDDAWQLDHTAYSGSRDRLWRGKYELLAYHDGAWEVRVINTVARGHVPGTTGLRYRARAAALRVLAARSSHEYHPMNPSGIFLVTCLKAPADMTSGEGPTRTRTWGYYWTFEEAERAVLANYTDMFEANYYDLAVIEFYPPGILVRPDERAWYRATYTYESDPPPYKARVELAEKPAAWRRYFGWGIS